MLAIGILFLIYFILHIIPIIITKHRQYIRDQVAHEILDCIDLQKENEDIKNLNKRLNFHTNLYRCPRCGQALVYYSQSIYQTSQLQVCIDYPKCKYDQWTH